MFVVNRSMAVRLSGIEVAGEQTLDAFAEEFL